MRLANVKKRSKKNIEKGRRPQQKRLQSRQNPAKAAQFGGSGRPARCFCRCYGRGAAASAALAAAVSLCICAIRPAVPENFSSARKKAINSTSAVRP